MKVISTSRKVIVTNKGHVIGEFTKKQSYIFRHGSKIPVGKAWMNFVTNLQHVFDFKIPHSYRPAWAKPVNKIPNSILDLAKKIGIPIDTNKHPAEDYGWDGRVIAGDNPYKEVVHDMAHWICSSPTRRLLPDFGLGQGPDSVARAKLVLKGHGADLEEHRASLLGILILRSLGFRKAWTYDYSLHGWTNDFVGGECGDPCRNHMVLKWLIEKGFISDKLKFQWPLKPAKISIPAASELFERIKKEEEKYGSEKDD